MNKIKFIVSMFMLMATGLLSAMEESEFEKAVRASLETYESEKAKTEQTKRQLTEEEQFEQALRASEAAYKKEQEKAQAEAPRELTEEEQFAEAIRASEAAYKKEREKETGEKELVALPAVSSKEAEETQARAELSRLKELYTSQLINAESSPAHIDFKVNDKSDPFYTFPDEVAVLLKIPNEIRYNLRDVIQFGLRECLGATLFFKAPNLHITLNIIGKFSEARLFLKVHQALLEVAAKLKRFDLKQAISNGKLLVTDSKLVIWQLAPSKELVELRENIIDALLRHGIRTRISDFPNEFHITLGVLHKNANVNFVRNKIPKCHLPTSVLKDDVKSAPMYVFHATKINKSKEAGRKRAILSTYHLQE